MRYTLVTFAASAATALAQPQHLEQGKSQCEGALLSAHWDNIDQLGQFCDEVLLKGKTLNELALHPTQRGKILDGCNRSDEEVKSTCQKVFSKTQAARRAMAQATPACEQSISEFMFDQFAQIARFCKDMVNNGKTLENILPPLSARQDILQGCDNSEEEVKATCQKIITDPNSAKPSEACNAEMESLLAPEPSLAPEDDYIASNFCADVLRGMSFKEVTSQKHIPEITINTILRACEGSEDILKSTCRKYQPEPPAAKAPAALEASEKCNTEINEQFKPSPGIAREDDYIPSSFCRDIMGGKSLENIGKEKYFNPLTLASIRNACEPSEEVIKLTCEKLPRFEPEPDSNPNFPTPSDTKFELNQPAPSNHLPVPVDNQPAANADPVTPTLPSTCQLDSKPCEWSECRPYDNGFSKYDPKTGKEIAYEGQNANGVPEGECKGRFGPACADGLYRKLVCGKRSTPDCRRNNQECYWVGQAPICPTYFHGDGKKDAHGRSFITGLDKQGGYTRMDPLADCREKAGARCEHGYRQLWCA